MVKEYKGYQLTVEQIKESFDIKTMRFNTCKRHPQTYVSWTSSEKDDLLFIRINVKTLNEVKRLISIGKTPLLNYEVINPSRAKFITNGWREGTMFDVVYLTEKGVETPYEDPIIKNNH